MFLWVDGIHDAFCFCMDVCVSAVVHGSLIVVFR